MSMSSSDIPAIYLSPILPTLTGREDDDEKDGAKPGEGGTGAGEQKQADNSAGTGGSTDESQGDPQKKITAQNEIIERKQRQLEERETELEELRKFKKTADDASLSDKERIDKRIEELERSSTAKDAALQKLVLHNSFLAANDVSWHDAETALSLLDTSGFEIVTDEKTGVPSVKDKTAFAKAIAKLAADKPYLVKTPTEDDGKPKGPQRWEGNTGDSPTKKPSDDAARRDRLKKKFPALRGRD